MGITHGKTIRISDRLIPFGMGLAGFSGIIYSVIYRACLRVQTSTFMCRGTVPGREEVRISVCRISLRPCGIYVAAPSRWRHSQRWYGGATLPATASCVALGEFQPMQRTGDLSVRITFSISGGEVV